MNHLQTITRGVTWNTLAIVGTKSITFATLFIILSRLSLFEYGLTELVLASISVVSLLTLPALIPVAIADIGVEISNRNYARVKGLFLSFSKLHMLLALVACVFASGAAYFGFMVFGTDSVKIFMLAIALVFLGSLRNIYTALMQAHLAFRAQSVFTVLEEVAKLAALLVFVWQLSWGAYGLIAAIVLSKVAVLTLYAPHMRTLYRRWGSVAPEKRSMLSFITPHARWSVLNNGAGSLVQNVRPWLIKTFLGTEAVALFAVAWGLVLQVMSFVPLSTVISPILPQSMGEPHNFKMLLEKGIRYQLIGNVLAGIGAAAVFPVIVYVLFPAYIPSIPLFWWLLVLLVPIAFDSFFASAFLALKAQKNMFIATTLKLVLTLVLLPLGALVGSFFGQGLYGLAAGFMLVQVFYVAERYRQLAHLVLGFKIAPRDFVTFDEYDVVVLNEIRRKWSFLRRYLPL